MRLCRQKKKTHTHVVDNRSLTAMKASEGAKAGIIFRSDTFGCDHWGVLDMLERGQIEPSYMKAYLVKGAFLYENRCGRCNMLAKDLDRKRCSLVNGVWCYICDEGNKGQADCRFFLCHPCLMIRKDEYEKSLEKGEGEESISVKRSTRNRRGR